jgi:hypothetical protein
MGRGKGELSVPLHARRWCVASAFGSRPWPRGGTLVSSQPTAWPPRRVAASGKRASRPEGKGRGQQAESAGGVLESIAGDGGIALWAWRAAFQRSGRRSPSCPAGVVGKRVSTSCGYAHGSMPRRDPQLLHAVLVQVRQEDDARLGGRHGSGTLGRRGYRAQPRDGHHASAAGRRPRCTRRALRIRKRLQRLEQRVWAGPGGCLRARYGGGPTRGCERQASRGEIRGQIIRPPGRRVPRSTYCLIQQAGLPTGPVGNHANDAADCQALRPGPPRTSENHRLCAVSERRVARQAFGINRPG